MFNLYYPVYNKIHVGIRNCSCIVSCVCHVLMIYQNIFNDTKTTFIQTIL